MALLVVLALVLAGCSAFGAGDPPPGDTVTPVSLETEAPSPTPPTWQVPGIDGTTITDEDALLGSHTRYLANRSFTLVWTRQAVGGSGTIGSSYRRDLAVENATTYRRISVGSFYPGEVYTYVDDTGLYRRTVAENGSTRAVRRQGGVATPRRRFAVLAVPSADMVIEPGETEVAIVPRGDATYARLVTRSPPEYFAGVYDDYDVRNFSATVWVHPDGYLRSVYYEFTLLDGEDGERIDIEVRYDYTAVGETRVSAPPWVERLRDQPESAVPTPTPTGTVAENGTTPAGNGTVTPGMTSTATPSNTSTVAQPQNDTETPDG